MFWILEFRARQRTLESYRKFYFIEMKLPNGRNRNCIVTKLSCAQSSQWTNAKWSRMAFCKLHPRAIKGDSMIMCRLWSPDRSSFSLRDSKMALDKDQRAKYLKHQRFSGSPCRSRTCAKDGKAKVWLYYNARTREQCLRRPSSRPCCGPLCCQQHLRVAKLRSKRATSSS